jgi:glycosyltransferase involved in cell wall biosynthesis
MTSGRERLRVLLVDPSLFSGPYDAALNEGLLAAGIEPRWAVRPLRPGDRADLSTEHADALFYRHVDGLSRLPNRLRRAAKGIAHLVGLARLMRRIGVSRPDVVHFQWTVFPALDAMAMLAIRRRCAVVVTVHDSTPGNGDGPWLYRTGQRLPMRVAHRLIVHTKAARQSLVARGVTSATIDVVPHGPLRLRVSLPERSEVLRDPRYTFVLFGELKAYKGIDVLIDAVAKLPDHVRQEVRVLVMGRAQMDVAPLLARVGELGLDGVVELRPRRLSEEEMAELFARADCFVFPYRVVDASGVYFLVRSLSRWIIASRVGVFSEELTDGVDGELVPVGDATALAAALQRAVTARTKPTPAPSPTDWKAIGRATLGVYRSALDSRARAGGHQCAPRP